MDDAPQKPESTRCILISMPSLLDPNFHQTASLISEFNKDGAMGVVLNRPLNISLTQILDAALQLPGEPVKVFWGGPVQNDRGWIVHEDASLAGESLQIEPGLFLSSSLSALQRLAENRQQPNPPRFRFFLGYAGWGAGQLEKEMAASSWVTAPLKRDLIFDSSPETLWERSLHSIGVNPMQLASAPDSMVQ
ncbi:MAG: YqgE/AlgH family protein [Pseudomonadota bacterium]